MKIISDYDSIVIVIEGDPNAPFFNSYYTEV